MTSPRLTSTSSARVRVTGWPRKARARSPSAVTMRSTFERRPEGSTTTSSPGATLPATRVPAKPRKFWFGRQTHCTGMRSPAPVSPSPTSTVSRCSSRDGPRYQGMAAEGPIMLSPLSADSGIACTFGIFSCAASSR